MDFLRFDPVGVEHFINEVFQKLGATPDQAGRTSKVMACADLLGLYTHGIERLPNYYDQIREGKINPAAQYTVLQKTPVSMLMDAENSLGHGTAVSCMELAIDMAKKNGVGVVSLRNANHYGIAGYYPLMAVKHHLIGFSVCNTEGLMVPTRSREALLGTNPIAFSMYAEPYPFLLDMATTVIPAGKLSLYSRDKKQLEPGWAVGRDGKTCTDPVEVRECINSKKTGGILPLGSNELFGSHKGYGLAMMVEILTSIMTGGYTSNEIRRVDKTTDRFSQFFAAFDYSVFGRKEEMEGHLSTFLHTLRGSERVEEKEEILTHGEREFKNYEYNRDAGLVIHEKTWQAVCALGRGLGLVPENYFTVPGTDAHKQTVSPPWI